MKEFIELYQRLEAGQQTPSDEFFVFLFVFVIPMLLFVAVIFIYTEIQRSNAHRGNQ